LSFSKAVKCILHLDHELVVISSLAFDNWMQFYTFAELIVFVDVASEHI